MVPVACVTVPSVARLEVLKRGLWKGASGQAQIRQIGTFSTVPEDMKIPWGLGIRVQVLSSWPAS